ncbi:hypothetical protein DCS_01421 [Drechmeria coniospora]|uniref:Uncharacterized protein n=1 Tax=Drechmeria coniospora TaxID=98403 RepID=A0A151GT36_DRECN|nr:hypothetical protein DCS_01421 [Drechmeria coniospora]KYK60284.1 hypothetical protein DCS_01421 [Drechmeria coniospora]
MNGASSPSPRACFVGSPAHSMVRIDAKRRPRATVGQALPSYEYGRRTTLVRGWMDGWVTDILSTALSALAALAALAAVDASSHGPRPQVAAPAHGAPDSSWACSVPVVEKLTVKAVGDKV